MALSAELDTKLQDFIHQSTFATSGAVVTDLDGTAVHEFQGKIIIPKEVELGLMRHYERGRLFPLLAKERTDTKPTGGASGSDSTPSSPVPA